MILSYFYWDPSPSIFSWDLPLLDRPILWYGAFFALGFFLSYLAFISLLRSEKSHEIQKNARKIADQISTYILVGIVLGARLFDIFFYEHFKQFLRDPLFIIRFWEGGLSSHGAVIGVVVATLIYQRRHHLISFLHLLDLFSVVAGVAAGCIRIGNFFNQEILGKPTMVPWAIIFGHPADGSFPVARHPVQLYEAFFYFILFGVMWSFKKRHWPRGRLCGLSLLLIFTFRFCIEFFKEEQSVWIRSSYLTMGQWLSIPLILLGLLLLALCRDRRAH